MIILFRAKRGSNQVQLRFWWWWWSMDTFGLVALYYNGLASNSWYRASRVAKIL